MNIKILNLTYSASINGFSFLLLFPPLTHSLTHFADKVSGFALDHEIKIPIYGI